MPSSLSSPLLLILFPLLGLVSATTIDIDGVEEPEDGDARTVFTSGGTYYIALNTTFLLYYSVLAGALLLAILALSGAFSSAESTSGYGQQYGYQQQYQQRAGAEEGYRNKRQAYSSGESCISPKNVWTSAETCEVACVPDPSISVPLVRIPWGKVLECKLAQCLLSLEFRQLLAMGKIMSVVHHTRPHTVCKYLQHQHWHWHSHFYILQAVSITVCIAVKQSSNEPGADHGSH